MGEIRRSLSKNSRQNLNNNRFETAYGGRYGRDSSVVADKFDKMKDKTMPYTSMYGGIHGRDPDVFYNNRQKKQLLM